MEAIPIPLRFIGKPSPAFRARIDHGLSLYEAGRVRKLLFSGGRMDGSDVSLAEAARDYAMAKGVPVDDILVEPWSTITWGNLVLSKGVGGLVDRLWKRIEDAEGRIRFRGLEAA